MASLSEVIAEFNNNFQYVNEKNQRQSRWYELWYHESIKKYLTDENLTKKLENAAGDCKNSLNNLSVQSGTEDFEKFEKAFFDCIAEALHSAQAARFNVGSVHARTFQHYENNESIFERYVVPKKPNFFEQQLIQALAKTKKKFPPHESFFKTLIETIRENNKSVYVFFHESMKKDVSGKPQYGHTEEYCTSEKLVKRIVR